MWVSDDQHLVLIEPVKLSLGGLHHLADGREWDEASLLTSAKVNKLELSFHTVVGDEFVESFLLQCQKLDGIGCDSDRCLSLGRSRQILLRSLRVRSDGRRLNLESTVLNRISLQEI